MLPIVNGTPANLEVEADGELTTGAEPWSVVVSPDGQRAFVANSGQDTITVIDVQASGGPEILGHVPLRPDCIQDDARRHFQPRGLAVTADSTKLYTARPSRSPRASTASRVTTRARSGWSAGSTSTPARPIWPTISRRRRFRWHPRNRLFVRARHPARLGVPQPAAEHRDPGQSGLSAEHRGLAVAAAALQRRHLRLRQLPQRRERRAPEGRGALNLHLGARDPEGDGAEEKKKLFFANPWAIAFTSQSGPGNAYVVSAGSDLLVKLDVTRAGALRFTDDGDTTRYIDLNDPENPETAGANAGKNPRGIVITEDGETAYVTNFVSRNVSVVDLTSDEVVEVIQVREQRTGPRGGPGRGRDVLLVARPLRPPDGTTVSTDERLSSEGWQACAAATSRA